MKISLRGKYQIVIAIFLIISAASLNVPNALATTDHDDVIQNTQSIELKRGSHEQTVTTSYLNLILDCSKWTSSGWAYSINCATFTSKLNNALDNESGFYAAERTAKVAFSIGNQELNIGDKYVALGANDNTNNYGTFAIAEGTKGLFLRGSSTTCAAYLALDSQNNPVVATVPCTSGNGEASQAAVHDDYWLWTSRSLFVDTSIDYQTGYEGAYAQSLDANLDVDNDGLDKLQELRQGTSDNNTDTDADGLDDHTESQWNSNRDALFCGNECAYPNPIKKDLYVEVDWMRDTNNRSFKPSTAQLALVQAAYVEQGIDAHFDIGQFGGGNELSSYISNLRFIVDPNGTDFYDYKSGTSTSAENFESNRYHIWHYLISGYEWNDGDPNEHDDEGSSGGTRSGDDDSFISTGLITDNQSTYGYSNLDTAIAGTILHELGHSLCLSSAASYTFQSSLCIYDAIDLKNNPPSTYESSMNYSKQMQMVNYSDGSHAVSPYDHDDWSAIALGINDFTQQDLGDDISSGTRGKNKKEKIIPSLNLRTADEFRKRGLYHRPMKTL